MNKGFDFPTVAALGLYDAKSEHVPDGASPFVAADFRPGDVSAADGCVTPNLNQVFSAATTCRRSLFRR